MYRFLMLPEQSFYVAILICCGLVAAFVNVRQMPMTAQYHREKWLQGGASTHERYIRRDEMDVIFEAHREAIENTQSEVAKPEVFLPPGHYASA